MRMCLSYYLIWARNVKRLSLQRMPSQAAGINTSGQERKRWRGGIILPTSAPASPWGNFGKEQQCKVSRWGGLAKHGNPAVKGGWILAARWGATSCHTCSRMRTTIVQKCSYSSGWGSQANGVLLVMVVHLFVMPEICLLPRSLILFCVSPEAEALKCLLWPATGGGLVLEISSG